MRLNLACKIYRNSNNAGQRQMVTKKAAPAEKLPPPSLVIPMLQVHQKLSERVSEGKKIKERRLNSEADLEQAREERTKWSRYNIEYLTRAFDNESLALEYQAVPQWGVIRMSPTFFQHVEGFIETVSRQITVLQSIMERLELIPESLPHSQVQAVPSSVTLSKSAVFIVHGRDDSAKTEVARFVEKLSLEAVILHEQANEGLTIIEKFERHAATVGCAVVLLTPDDVAAPKATPEDLKARARQNVILELGYFCGALTRAKVCVMYWPGVELPSDIHGLTYIPYDPQGGWHLPLARELKRAGLAVDANGAL